MKFSIYLSILILATLFSCDNNNDTPENIPSAITQNRAATSTESKAEDTTPKPVTITGKFRSLQGVMNVISTKCYRGGTITTEDGTEVAVCFENIKADNVSCQKISVTGIQTTIKDMEFLDVSNFECLD